MNNTLQYIAGIAVAMSPLSFGGLLIGLIWDAPAYFTKVCLTTFAVSVLFFIVVAMLSDK